VSPSTSRTLVSNVSGLARRALRDHHTLAVTRQARRRESITADARAWNAAC